MRQKTFTITLFICALLAMSTPVYARACQICPMKHKEGRSQQSDFSPKDQFYHKAHYILENQEALGLSEDQIAKITSLKTEIKKNLILQEAESEVLAIDIKSKLHEDTLDVKGIDALIDKKYDLERANTKALIKSFSELKNVLTPEQKKTLKTLWKESKKPTGSGT